MRFFKINKKINVATEVCKLDITIKSTVFLLSICILKSFGFVESRLEGKKGGSNAVGGSEPNKVVGGVSI